MTTLPRGAGLCFSLAALILSLLFSITSSYAQVILDSSFGTNGSTRTWIPGSAHLADYGYSVLMQPDGKIIVVGTSRNGSLHFSFAVLRFLSDGTLDTGFGTNGATITPIPGGGYDDKAYSAVLQPDGKIVAFGSSRATSMYNPYYDFALARWDSTGILDPSFAGSGAKRLAVPGGAADGDNGSAVLLLPDKKIIGVGSSTDYSNNYCFALVRFDSAGSTDATFGSSGAARTFIAGGSSRDYATSAALQSEGKIIAGGVSYYSTGHYAFALARYFSNGTLDGTFGSNGTVRTYIKGGDSTNDRLFATLVQNDGKIVAAGESHDTSGHTAMTVVRYNSDGSLDTTFGSGGFVRAFIAGGDSTDDAALAAVVQPDSKILVAGSSHDLSGHMAFSLARFYTNGTLDHAFGSNGTTRNFNSGGNSTLESANAVMLQPDQKIVAAGSADDATGFPGVALARYLQNDVGLSARMYGLTAAASKGTVTLTWQTASDVDNAGFNVLRRAISASAFELISSYKSNPALRGTLSGTRGGSYSFVDMLASHAAAYVYRIECVSASGEIASSRDISVTLPAPASYALRQNYPNPFNPATSIQFDLKEASSVTLEIFDVLGDRIQVMHYGTLPAGSYEKMIDLSHFAGGVYFYRLIAVGSGSVRFESVRKFLLLK